MRRLHYRHEVTELEVYDALTSPAEFGSMFVPQARVSSVLELLGHAVLFVVRVAVFTVGLTVRIVLPIVGELVCLAIASLCCAVGLLGRGLDYVGCAAARRSWVITAGADALSKLPPPCRVERVPNHRPAIVVRPVR